MKRTNTRTDKEQIPLLSLSLCTITSIGTQPPSGTQPPFFLMYVTIGTQPFLLFGTQPLFVQLCILISSATVGLSCPAAAVAVPGPQLLRIALIDRPSHACTDMTHYIQVRYIPQARDPSRCNGQARMKPVGQAWAKAYQKDGFAKGGRGFTSQPLTCPC